MSDNNIIIFSRAIRTGKTTELLAWCSQQTDVYGIATPDVNGSRILLDLHTNQQYLFQNEKATNTINVGRYNFDNEVFAIGKASLIKSIKLKPKWLVIDEIGNLEIQQDIGWEPAFSTIIDYYEEYNLGKLVVVVRDSLLMVFQEKYNAHRALVINSLNEL